MLKKVALLAAGLTLTLSALADSPSNRIEKNPVAAKHTAPAPGKGKRYHNGVEVNAFALPVETPLNAKTGKPKGKRTHPPIIPH
jgi:hypothetical protein